MSSRGAAPGERRGGRKKGTLNKSTADIKELFRQYTDQAKETIVAISLNPTHPQQLAAAREVLDRGWGKPAQTIDGNITGNLTVKFVSGFGND